MSTIDKFLTGYENTRLIDCKDIDVTLRSNTLPYADICAKDVVGVLKANRLVDGKLVQTYSERENHVGVIAATRLGKTTQYVIPTILSFAKAKNKRSMVVSDPKGELYRLTSATLRKEGYKVKLVNFRDYRHSEYWNPLTKIYSLFEKANNVEDEIEVVETPAGLRNRFCGRIYENQSELDLQVSRVKKMAMEDVANEIDAFAAIVSPTINIREPYWEDSARDVLKAGLWAMLEDSLSDDESTRITKDNFSLNTLLSIFTAAGSVVGYFSERDKDSRSYNLAMCIVDNGKTTNSCIISTFNTKMSVFKNSTVRLVTSCNSFDMNELIDDEHPVAVYIDYRDESKADYGVISMFIQSIYEFLIDYATKQPSGKLNKPFYLVLDEFGNFPAIKDFETVISACGGRNIFFILILQSYAQLNNVYGESVSEIIKDNLNMHVFIGSNNPDTLASFSRECGEFTRISPMSAINGNADEITYYERETIPLIPKSVLSNLKEGECIVTEANCGYVLFSKLERYYLCPEYENIEISDEKDYFSSINPFDEKYAYKYESPKKKFDFDF